MVFETVFSTIAPSILFLNLAVISKNVNVFISFLNPITNNVIFFHLSKIKVIERHVKFSCFFCASRFFSASVSEKVSRESVVKVSRQRGRESLLQGEKYASS